MRSDADSTVPTESERVRFTSAIPTCETCLMMDTCADGGICPRGSDQTAQRDTTVTTQSVTALDDSAHGSVDETHFGNYKFQVRCNETDVVFIILSAGKTSQQSDWFELNGGYQVMLPGPGEQTRTCAKDSNVARLEENRRVYWLPGSAAESTDGASLNVVEATTEPLPLEFDATQLEESESTQTQTQDNTTSREQGTNTIHVRSHIFSPGHGVERQWIKHTDLRQAGTRVKTGEGRIFFLVNCGRSTAREKSLESFGVGSKVFSKAKAKADRQSAKCKGKGNQAKAKAKAQGKGKRSFESNEDDEGHRQRQEL